MHVLHITAADGKPEEAWLIDGDTKPQNLLGNVNQAASAGVPVIAITQHQERARNHVKALTAAWDTRVAAANKVAGS